MGEEVRRYFPVEPYPQQLQYVADFSNHIQRKTILLESPTGTGKSFSLLVCAYIWLDQFKWEARFYADQPLSQEPSAAASALPSWISGSLLKESKQKLKIEHQRQRVKARTEALAQRVKSPSQKTVQFNRAKVIIASRTHSQLSQLVKTHDSLKSEYSSLVLASRQLTCVHPTIDKKKVDLACRQLCQKEGCPFNTGREGDLAFFDKSSEQVYEVGKATKTCGYYATRGLLDLADIVFVPYASLLSEKARNSLGIQLQNSLVIFDQAHNVVEADYGLNSHELTLKDLQTLEGAISQYLDKFGARLKVKNKYVVDGLRQLAGKVAKFLGEAGDSDVVVDPVRFIYGIGADKFDLRAIEQFLDESHFQNKIGNFVGSRLLALVLSVVVGGEDSLLVFKKSSCSLKAVALQPSQLAKIVATARSTVFTGGTLTPSFDFKRFDPAVFRYDHILPLENCQILVVPRSGQRQFHFTHANRSKQTFQSVAKLLAGLQERVEGGLVCFVQSYQFLKELASTLASKQWLSRPAVVEEQGRNSFAEYQQLIKLKGKGTLVAVMGGSLSEGINFSDALARLLVVVGLPFPNYRQIELKQRLGRTCKTEKQRMAVCEEMCFRVVNQTIGRIVRHRHDFGQVVLLDRRFGEQHSLSLLSEWVRPRVMLLKDAEQLAELVQTFGASHLQ